MDKDFGDWSVDALTHKSVGYSALLNISENKYSNKKICQI